MGKTRPAINLSKMDGYYKFVWNKKVHSVVTVTGEDATLDILEQDDTQERRIIETGDFKETDKDILELTGKTKYQVKLSDPANPEDVAFGVVGDDSNMITFKGIYGVIFTMEKIDEDQAKSLKEAAELDKDPVDAPSNHYTLRPGHVGKLVFISGVTRTLIFHQRTIMLLMHCLNQSH